MQQEPWLKSVVNFPFLPVALSWRPSLFPLGDSDIRHNKNNPGTSRGMSFLMLQNMVLQIQQLKARCIHHECMNSQLLWVRSPATAEVRPLLRISLGCNWDANWAVGVSGAWLPLQSLIVWECLLGGFLCAVSHESFVPLQAEQHTAPRDWGHCLWQAWVSFSKPSL